MNDSLVLSKSEVTLIPSDISRVNIINNQDQNNWVEIKYVNILQPDTIITDKDEVDKAIYFAKINGFLVDRDIRLG